MKTNTSPAMARGLAAIVMAFAFAQAGALSQAGISEEDRPKGSRGQEIERELTAETDREIAERGCAVVGDKKWFADSFGKPFQFQQDGCNISFKVKRENRKIQEKRGTVKGRQVFVEGFPPGNLTKDQAIVYENGAKW